MSSCRNRVRLVFYSSCGFVVLLAAATAVAWTHRDDPLVKQYFDDMDKCAAFMCPRAGAATPDAVCFVWFAVCIRLLCKSRPHPSSRRPPNCLPRTPLTTSCGCVLPTGFGCPCHGPNIVRSAPSLQIEQPENIPTCLATKPYPRRVIAPLLRGLRLLR